jgi:hypothetical protein
MQSMNAAIFWNLLVDTTLRALRTAVESIHVYITPRWRTRVWNAGFLMFLLPGNPHSLQVLDAEWAGCDRFVCRDVEIACTDEKERVMKLEVHFNHFSSLDIEWK